MGLMKKRKVWPIWVAVIGVIAIGGSSFVLLSQDTSPEYSTVKASKQTVEVSVAANGQLVDEVTFGLAAGVDPIVTQTALADMSLQQPVQGIAGYTVTKVLVEAGEPVKKNQRLVRLENPLGQESFLRAPSKGIVRSLKAVKDSPATGELVSLGTGKLLSVVRVSEYDIAELTIGQEARVNIDALGGEFSATVLQIGQKADGTTGVQRYLVLLEIADLPETARLGMSTNAKIIIQSLPNTLSVPANAIVNLDGKNVVAVIGSEGDVLPTEVTVGVVGDTLVEIASGLNENDEVVVGQIGNIPEVNSQFGPPPGVRSNNGGN